MPKVQPRISGKVILWSPPGSKHVALAVRNEGSVPFGLSNNYFDSRDEMQTKDYLPDDPHYGHGLECAPDSWSWQEFPLGARYRDLKIRPGGVMRLGLRSACWAAVDVPKPGASPLVLDIERDFKWYEGSPQKPESHVAMLPTMAYYRQTSMHRNVDRDPLIEQLCAIMDPKKGAEATPAGRAFVEAHVGVDGQTSHWIVRFENDGDTAFIGTVAFKGESRARPGQTARPIGKNDGIGLESMPVPHRGSAAEQRIEAGADYGVRAQPGSIIRLGIRGFGVGEVELPSKGVVTLSADDLDVRTSQWNASFFDREEVCRKRQEKRAHVRFFEHGEAINGQLEAIEYRGAEALARAPFDPPRLRVHALAEGGWKIDIESTLPDVDLHGRIGFRAELELSSNGAIEHQLPSHMFSSQGLRHTWFVPQLGANGGAVHGHTLVVRAIGTGWTLAIDLPALGSTVDADGPSHLWCFRPDEHRRAGLAM